MNLTKKVIEEKIKNQIAIEFNCSPADFDKPENLITAACMDEKRRKFSDKPFFLQMATFGKSTVISADESIHPWLNVLWYRSFKSCILENCPRLWLQTILGRS